ncbi:transposase [Paracoccus sp. SSJ]|nr:transposase [Paracoccus sp. SSJ]MDK8874198.1 transposase [Paracoccus sp. SSJ]
MLSQTLTLPEDPEELRSFTARLLAEVKAQAILIEKLRHQLAGHRAHRFGASSETAEQLQLALETSEIAAAAMTARMKLPDIEEKDKPRRRPIPDHIPRMEVELTPGADACADCGGRLRRIGEDGEARARHQSEGRAERRAGVCAGPLHREPYCPAPPDLHLLRTVRAGPAALTPHRTRAPWAGSPDPWGRSSAAITRPQALRRPATWLKPSATAKPRSWRR